MKLKQVESFESKRKEYSERQTSGNYTTDNSAGRKL